MFWLPAMAAYVATSRGEYGEMRCRGSYWPGTPVSWGPGPDLFGWIWEAWRNWGWPCCPTLELALVVVLPVRWCTLGVIMVEP